MQDQPTITAGELAKRLGGTLTGDAGVVVRDVAILEKAGPNDLSWVGTPDVLKRAADSKAGVFVIPEGCSLEGGCTTIAVKDPDMAISDVLRILAPPGNVVEPGVHPTAIVAEDAKVEGAAIGAHVYVGAGAVIGAGTQLHPNVYVGPHSKIGVDCILWPSVVVRERCTVGDRVQVHPNATIGGDGFGYHFRDGVHHKIPQIGCAVIEDDVEIGANSTIDRARSGVTRIGRGTKIDNLVHIGHNADIGEGCLFVALCGISGSTTIGRYCVFAGKAATQDHVHVGDGVQVWGNSAVTNDIPAGLVVRGHPAIAARDSVRQAASVRRLPKWMEKVRSLFERVDALEKRLSDKAD